LSVSIIDPKQLKRIRKQLGLTQAALAKASGISQSLVAKLENGSVDPTYSTIKAISMALRAGMNVAQRKASDVMSSPVMTVQSTAPMSDCVGMMRKNAISQLPVYAGQKMMGSISESVIVKILAETSNPAEVLKRKVAEFVQPPFPIVSPETPTSALYSLFEFMPAVLVSSGERIEGIIAKIDLLAGEMNPQP
jgi:predicted transcriptional regulator